MSFIGFGDTMESTVNVSNNPIENTLFTSLYPQTTLISEVGGCCCWHSGVYHVFWGQVQGDK